MFFVAVGFSDLRVARMLDVMRIICEPDAARPSHVTLRGPYDAKKNVSNSLLEKDVGQMIVRGPRTFFSDAYAPREQNTVYLGIEISGIGDYWHKPQYPDGTPHLTIYDGKSRKFAWIVLTTLRKHSWNFSVNSTPMRILEKKKGVEQAYLEDFENYRLALDQVFFKGVAFNQIRALSDIERAGALNKACHILHDLTRPFSKQY
ncbi:hypothetical protein [uncultured Jannaschia sp.]|uniref:hypothetical protein n=1 Tax=uncultured Jannaschia sp. TaxID=293347 RepID=UPI002602832A|nr:hypothetical protein [uncultured Jannaschia sp.]